jgi:hypothetical protein
MLFKFVEVVEVTSYDQLQKYGLKRHIMQVYRKARLGGGQISPKELFREYKCLRGTHQA